MFARDLGSRGTKTAVFSRDFGPRGTKTTVLELAVREAKTEAA